MAGDTAATLEQLLRRFEALRSSGAIKLLVIEQAPGATPARELPPGCQPFARAARTSSTLYGTPAGTGPRVYLWRWLGERGQVDELLTGIEAAGQLLAVPLAKVGFIHPADYVAPRDLASRSAWLVAMLAAAEQGLLQADGIVGSWRHWAPGEGLACDSATVKLYRSPAGQELAAADPVRLVAAAVDTATRFAVFPNAVESCIALLRCLAIEPPKPKKPKASKPFPNLRECLLKLMETAGGKDRFRACGTLQEVCDFIHEEYPEQPATPSLLKGLGTWPTEEEGGMKWLWGKGKRRPGHTVVSESSLGEHFDLDNIAR